MSWGDLILVDNESNSHTVKIAGYTYDIPAQCVTKDNLTAGTVEIVDIDNKNPVNQRSLGVGGGQRVRLLPNGGNYAKLPTRRWIWWQDWVRQNKMGSLMLAYIFSCKMNPVWQRERPIYRKGAITSVDDETNTVGVRLLMPYRQGRHGFPTISDCPVEYMSCNSAAFNINDSVVVEFEDDKYEKPKVIGFWDDPKGCFLPYTDWGQFKTIDGVTNPFSKDYLWPGVSGTTCENSRLFYGNQVAYLFCWASLPSTSWGVNENNLFEFSQSEVLFSGISSYLLRFSMNLPVDSEHIGDTFSYEIVATKGPNTYAGNKRVVLTFSTSTYGPNNCASLDFLSDYIERINIEDLSEGNHTFSGTFIGKRSIHLLIQGFSRGVGYNLCSFTMSNITKRA